MRVPRPGLGRQVCDPLQMSLLDRLRGVFGGRSKPSGPTCLVCDATEIETLALGAYRCGMCGHEGGDGLPEYLAGRRRAEILALPEPQRKELAVRSAAAARNLLNGIDLSAASGPRPEEIALKVASHLVGMSGGLKMVAGHQDHVEEMQRENLRIVRDLMEAETLLDETATALGEQFMIPPNQRMARLDVSVDSGGRGQLLGRARNLLVETDRLEPIARHGIGFG